MTARPAIVDTNVLVAGMLTGDPASPPARILDGMIAGRFPFVISTTLLAEYRDVLLRPRIRSLHGLEPGQIDDLLSTIAANAIVREVEPARGDAPDPGDQHLWDLLEATPRAVLITGDSALAEGPPARASVLSPRAWIDRDSAR